MLSVVVPSYNERHGIATMIERVHQALQHIDHEIVVVDDSGDGTDDVLRSLSQSDARLRFAHREGKRGLASAVMLGFELARGDVLCVMDADLQHPPELLPDMFQEITDGADLVIPSRFLSGSSIRTFSSLRRMYSMGGKWLGKLLLRSLSHATDPMGGFLMLRRSVIEHVRLKPIGWRVQMEVLAMGHYRRVVEIPYSFQPRYADHSKMSLKPTLEYVGHVLMLIVRSERERRFYLFALVGMSGILIDMLMFYILHTRLALGLNASATMSAICAALYNHTLNRHVTWRHERRHGAGPIALEMLRFAAVYCVGIALKNLVLYALVAAGLSPAWANLLGIFAAGLCNYALCARYVFPRVKRPEFVRRTLPDGGDDPCV